MKHVIRAWLGRSSRVSSSKSAGVGPLIESFESRRLLSAGLSVKSILADNRGQVVITMSTSVNPSSVTAATAEILTAGPDGRLNTADDTPVTTSLQASGNQIFLTADLPADTLYRVRLLSGKNGVKSTRNKMLSGNSKGSKGGRAGGNFDDTAVAASFIAHFRTIAGDMNVTLASDTPITNANFLQYVNEGAYDNSFIHRKAPFGSDALHILQGGGYVVTPDDGTAQIIPHAPIVKENGSLSNVKGTIAMSRTSNPSTTKTAMSQWFFNTEDNTPLDTLNGGYTAFGKLADAASFATLAALESSKYPPIDASGGTGDQTFAEMPVVNYNGSGNIDPKTNLVIIYRVAMLMSVEPSSLAGQIAG